jgi:serine/threonine protein kinase
VLSDFGLSAYLQYGALNSSYGTPLYAAPEILLNKEYDEKVDVYSFGILLNFTVTLIRPYEDIPGDNAWLLKSIYSGVLRPTCHSSARLDQLYKALTLTPADPLIIKSEVVREWTMVVCSIIAGKCWHNDSTSRISMTKVTELLAELLLIMGEERVMTVTPEEWINKRSLTTSI